MPTLMHLQNQFTQNILGSPFTKFDFSLRLFFLLYAMCLLWFNLFVSAHRYLHGCIGKLISYQQGISETVFIVENLK